MTTSFFTYDDMQPYVATGDLLVLHAAPGGQTAQASSPERDLEGGGGGDNDDARTPWTGSNVCAGIVFVDEWPQRSYLWHAVGPRFALVPVDVLLTRHAFAGGYLRQLHVHDAAEAGALAHRALALVRELQAAQAALAPSHVAMLRARPAVAGTVQSQTDRLALAAANAAYFITYVYRRLGLARPIKDECLYDMADLRHHGDLDAALAAAIALPAAAAPATGAHGRAHLGPELPFECKPHETHAFIDATGLARPLDDAAGAAHQRGGL
jgi:hypothetical protein